MRFPFVYDLPVRIALLLIFSILPACIQAGCVRNSDCVAADWCIETQCVPRPVSVGEGGVPSAASKSTSDGAAGSMQDASTQKDASTSHDAGTRYEAGVDAAQQP
jgi:hypothetical protein